MYIALYGKTMENGFRTHIGNLVDVSGEIGVRTFDLDGGQITGLIGESTANELIFTLKEENGKPLYSGFIKNIKSPDGTYSYSAEDLRKVFDTDVILDFSQEESPSHSLSAIFTKVSNAVKSSSNDPFIVNMNLQFHIDEDLTDTKGIADYTGRYIIVNALKFLKVYLGYYGYYIEKEYDIIHDAIVFSFVKSQTSVVKEIKMIDFIHERTASDIKVNKSIATVSFNTVDEDAVPEWELTDFETYNTSKNKIEIIGAELPPVENYSDGYAVKLIGSKFFEMVTVTEYLEAAYKTTKYITDSSITQCGPIPDANSLDPTVYLHGEVLRLYYRIPSTGTVCPQAAYYRVVESEVTYYRLKNNQYIPRPAMPGKIYTLGTDNEIYEGYAPEEKRIYPVVSRIFEANYLYEAQINAVYELVSNRYVENIVITNDEIINPVDLSSLKLYEFLRVFDTQGNSKLLPVSEITMQIDGNRLTKKIKLGFKKTSLTEIIKNDVSTSPVTKQSTGGTRTSITNENKIWTSSSAPDVSQYKIWLKPIE